MTRQVLLTIVYIIIMVKGVHEKNSMLVNHELVISLSSVLHILFKSCHPLKQLFGGYRL